jgi:catechol 2,3-dioxygenase-like lactoylglutathione lyase family enzyme
MVTVKRIVPDISYRNPEQMRAFYQEVLGLSAVMDMGWVATMAVDAATRPQLTMMKDMGEEPPIMSIEVDDVDQAHQAAQDFGATIARDICNEAWGVRRFFVRDPDGNLLNILAHT